MKQTFSVSTTLKQAWQKVSGTKLTFYRLLLVLGVLKIISELSDPDNLLAMSNIYGWDWLRSDALYITLLLLSVVGAAIYILCFMAETYFGLKRVYGHEIHFSMIRDVAKPKLFLRYVLMLILMSVSMMIPMIASILIGVVGGFVSTVVYASMIKLIVSIFYLAAMLSIFYVYIRLSLAGYILLAPCMGEEPVSAWQSIKLSWQYTKGHVVYLLLLKLANLLLMLLSFASMLIGLIWTLPLQQISAATAYMALREAK